MVSYRRNFVPGGTYFFTLTLRDRSSQLLTKHIDLLRWSIKTTKSKSPFTLKAIVILPDHIHLLITLPENDSSYVSRIRTIKSRFSCALNQQGFLSKTKSSKGYQIWQARYWEHTIRDKKDLNNHINYIHYNPVKHGHVKKVQDWPWSSFHRFVKQGHLPLNWGGGDSIQIPEGKYGE